MKAASNPKGRTNLMLAELMAHNTNDWIVIATLTQHLQKAEDEINVLKIALQETFNTMNADCTLMDFQNKSLMTLDRLLEKARREYERQ